MSQKMKKKEYIRKCRDHWQWLADNPESNKEDYFQVRGVDLIDRPSADCYLCEVHNNLYNIGVCVVGCFDRCLITWSGGHCNTKGIGEYYHWWNAKTLERRKYWAQKIVQLCDDALSEY